MIGVAVLREDKNLEMVRLPPTLPRIFRGRWTLKSGERISSERWKDDRIHAWKSQQLDHPVCLRRNGRKSLWWFRDRFYWDADRRSAEDVKALALRRLRREERVLKSAHAVMKGEDVDNAGRAPIPADITCVLAKNPSMRSANIDHIRDVTGSLDHVAIGSDLDGYIKPALPGLEHMGHMRALQDSLAERYGPENADKIANGNALRVLRSAWRTAPPAAPRTTI